MQSWVNPTYFMFLLLGKSVELEEGMFDWTKAAEAHLHHPSIAREILMFGIMSSKPAVIWQEWCKNVSTAEAHTLVLPLAVSWPCSSWLRVKIHSSISAQVIFLLNKKIPTVSQWNSCFKGKLDNSMEETSVES